jgi:hypothetical protein
MATTVLTESPSLGSLYVKAAMPSLPGAHLVPALRKPVSDSLPDTRLELHGVGFDLGHVGHYREVCGFPRAVAIPSTYPHVLAFPLHLALMTVREFPFAVLGAVHLENTIEQLRPLQPDDLFDLSVQATQLGPHPRGRTVTVVSEAAVGGEVVWRDASVFLSRGRSSGERSGPAPALPGDAPAGPVRWPLDSGLGRRYAAVSGDRNPIHLSTVTARAFGFPTQIAHGMWTKARVLAALAPRLPAAFAVTVSFKKPVPLPSTVCFGARDREDAIDFGLTSGTTGAPHLLGRVTRL